MSKTTVIVLALVATIVALFGTFAAGAMFFARVQPEVKRINETAKRATENTALGIVAQKLNEDLPRMTNAEVREDSVSAGDRRLIHKLTFVKRDAYEIDPRDLRRKWAPAMARELCAGDARPMLDKGVTLTYVFLTRNAERIATIDFTSADCRN